MPDITMCSGENCLVKQNCYRYTAKPNLRQSYFLKPPGKDKECTYFYDNYNSNSLTNNSMETK